MTEWVLDLGGESAAQMDSIEIGTRPDAKKIDAIYAASNETRRNIITKLVPHLPIVAL